MSINIEQIIIMIDTNIPDKEPFKLTSSVIYHPTLKKGKTYKYSELPYFTNEVRYPYSDLQYLAKLDYKKIVRFFFDKKYFESKMILFLDKLRKNKTDTSENNNNKSDSEKDNILKYNVGVMLNLLFPTYFPSPSNHTTSFQEYIKQNPSSDISLKGLLSTKHNFSYLNIGGTTYTITKVTWLNDLLNHPIYRNFIDEFINYSNWASKESINILGVLTKKKENLFKRLKREAKKSDTLYIGEFIDNFIKNKLAEPISSFDRDYLKRQFYEDLDKLISIFEEYNSIVEKPALNDEDYNNLNALNKDLEEAYKRLKDNTRISLKGISDVFKVRLAKIREEFKKINITEKIKENYITTGQVNINLQGEDPDVVKELESSYTRYTDFVKKIRELLPPTRESSNTELQNRILNYSENVETEDRPFTEIMKGIKDELIYLKGKSKFSQGGYQDIIYTGTNIINKNKYNEPHYEIYIGVDLIEGEINDSNLDPIKCKYRGLYLGKETENYFSKYNPYDYEQHRVFVPVKEEVLPGMEEKKEEKQEKVIEKKEEDNKNVKGGKYTLKKKKNKRSTKKRFN